MELVWVPNLNVRRVKLYDSPEDEAPRVYDFPEPFPNIFGVLVSMEDGVAEVVLLSDEEETKRWLRDDVIRFRAFTPALIRELNQKLQGIYGKSFINPQDRQNYAPSFQKALEVAEKHGLLLGGYVVFPPREDFRITIDTIYIPVKKTLREIQQIQEELDHLGMPDDRFITEINEEKFLGLWWD